MFFLFSKLFYFLTKPLNWILIGCIRAMLVSSVWKKKKAIKFVLISSLFFTNPLAFNLVAKWWEPELVPLHETQKHDIAIVLGGFTRSGLYRVDDRYTGSAACPRLTVAMELYKMGKVDKILISSGDGAVFRRTPEPEADEVRSFLVRLGIPHEAIIIENSSKNTRENAVFTAKIVAEKFPESKCLLVTSGSHMPRSIACFNKAGLSCTSFPADNKAERITNEPRTWLSPDPQYLEFWQFLIKEWIGYFVYKMVGYA